MAELNLAITPPKNEEHHFEIYFTCEAVIEIMRDEIVRQLRTSGVPYDKVSKSSISIRGNKYPREISASPSYESVYNIKVSWTEYAEGWPSEGCLPREPIRHTKLPLKGKTSL